ncbi:ABC transporter permease [Puia sp. P3]|uniref:ABC transporter permease n=1 Tax=Puia sp. P3 TaxID=3423952 RepID=UPI003D66AFD5
MANIYIFSVVGAFILLIACINFVNLTTARSTERAKEVGIRKVVGAERGQLTNQFLGESILQCRHCIRPCRRGHRAIDTAFQFSCRQDDQHGAVPPPGLYPGAIRDRRGHRSAGRHLSGAGAVRLPAHNRAERPLRDRQPGYAPPEGSGSISVHDLHRVHRRHPDRLLAADLYAQSGPRVQQPADDRGEHGRQRP